MANELILLIEDNLVNRTLIRDVLSFKGYQTLEAASAEEGIKLAIEKKPALVLMDFQLPGMNGIDAFHVLRADATTRRDPVGCGTDAGSNMVSYGAGARNGGCGRR